AGGAAMGPAADPVADRLDFARCFDDLRHPVQISVRTHLLELAEEPNLSLPPVPGVSCSSWTNTSSRRPAVARRSNESGWATSSARWRTCASSPAGAGSSV